MIKSEQASLSVVRIAIITIITIFLLSICVLASSIEVKNVKIILADNCEIDVLTTKSLVSDILEENHIVVLPEENVVPNLDSEITDNHSSIVVTGVTQDAYAVVSASEEGEELLIDRLLSSYNTIIEKIIVLEEQIPYETVTKGERTTNETTTMTIQEGKEGLKRATYKVKYQNDIEIGRTLIKEEILQEPTSKIVEITNITNRSSKTNTTKTNVQTPRPSNTALASKVEGKEPIVKTLNASAYTAAGGGKSPNSAGYGKTASGAMATAWYTVAAGSAYPMGTIIYIPHFANQPNRRMVCSARQRWINIK